MSVPGPYDVIVVGVGGMGSAADEPLLHVTGSLDVGPEGSEVFDGSRRSCLEHGLPHETLDAPALAHRFPGWRPAPDMMAVLQPDGGFLTPERCIAVHAARAAALGATIRDLDAMDRICRPEDEATLRAAVSRHFPAANGALRASSTCLFTNTLDEHFIVDRAPGAPEVLLVSPCSGHGFKFCSVIGEICADFVTRGATAHDVSLFRLARFASGAPTA